MESLPPATLLSPGLRAVLDGLLSAAKTQTLLLSDLEHVEAILKDPSDTNT
jgi:hypothetical protein